MNVGKIKVMRCSRYVMDIECVCTTEWRSVRGSGLFQVPGIAKCQQMEDEKTMWYTMNEGHIKLGE